MANERTGTAETTADVEHPDDDDRCAPNERFFRPRRTLRSVSVLEILLWCWFAIAAWQIKWISDDGYIYFAYVRNLTENGWGPVLNPGERVEGFTSPAWYVILSATNIVRIDRWLDLRQTVILLSLALSLTAVAIWIRVESLALRREQAGVDLAAATATSGHAPTDTSDRGGVGSAAPTFWRAQARLNLPLAFVAAWYPLHSFATSGLETPLQVLALMAVVAYVWSGTDSDWIAGGLAGTLPLVRPELGLLSLLLLGRHWYGSRGVRSVAISLALFALPLVASVAIRVRVYGQLLPNTFYTKTDTGYGVDSGLDYLRDTSLAYGLHWVLVAAVLVIVVPVVAGRTPPTNPAWRCRVWFLAASAAMTAYTVAVGGDFMHARFLLTSVVLLMAVFAGLGSRAVASLGTDHGRRAALAAVATILVVAATRSTEPVQRALTQPDATRGAVFGDVADEAYSYLYRNPALHDWDQSTHDRWTYRGRAARGLAERLDTEIGIVSGGIGQITFAGQANGGRVYVYDLLGLTRPDIARLDMLGTERRVGHAKRAPDVLIAANPRVDFHDLYFPGWRDAAFVRYDDRGFVLANLDLIDPLVERGVILPEDATRIRRWILDQLSGPTIDRNFVTFVTMRYHRDDEILERVRELGDLDRASAWRRWLDATAEERALLEPTGCSGLSTTDCWRRAIDRQRAAPFPTLPNGPDPVEVEPVEMEPVEVEPG